jgi:hypothetical protein
LRAVSFHNKIIARLKETRNELSIRNYLSNNGGDEN